jgi:uncharacterized membrane protein YagU involved in acid resistance
MNSIFRGFWASTMATSSMTLALFESFKKLPDSEKQPLPPAQLTENVVRKTGFTKNWSSEMQAEATMISHYGYGAAAGIAYALLADKVPGNSLIKGGLFGLGVWAASYYGIIPSLKLSPSGDDMSKERNTMMALTHVVWGASLGFAENSLRKKGFSMLDGQRKNEGTTLH